MQWKAIPGYEGFYEVSDQGQVRSVERTTSHGHRRKQKVLRAGLDGGGYPKVDLSKDNKQTTRLIHQLVLETFVGPRPEGYETCHKDGVRSNNALKNLRYDTKSENAYDRSGHDRHIREAHPMAILTEKEVREIRAWPKYQRGLYAQFPQVTRHAIDQIRSGYNWKSLV
jgi:hypothetical protein